MKSGQWQWRIVGTAAMLCTVVLAAGFVWAVKDAWFPAADGVAPPASEAPPAAGGSWADKPELLVTALGDSLTRGTGDAAGEGYVRPVLDGLADKLDKPVKLVNNLAVNGMTIDELAVGLQGNGYRNAIARADIVLMTIGGNDLFRFADDGDLTMAEGAELAIDELEGQLQEAANRLRTILSTIREMNGNARIVYVGLYNPFYDMEELRRASEAVQSWNAAAHRLTAADGNATVVPTYDLFESESARYLSSDHFHPNDDGYARIAERIVQALT